MRAKERRRVREVCEQIDLKLTLSVNLKFFPFELCGFFLPLKAGPEFDKKKNFFLSV